MLTDAFATSQAFVSRYSSMDEDFCPFLHTPCSIPEVTADKVQATDSFLSEQLFKNDRNIPLKKLKSQSFQESTFS